ncbi:nucleoside-diphosphate-sugar epimerase [Flavobacterium sp. CG_9.1]|uniref:NAD-dependent epimerase/dehydratase family protein n=1 Tax=Flavobacterium sp. CG_9.1 TaxID=2787728 RepID=UPI0018CA0C36|nr:NAD(P)-dependent oxidoreductase [Flavobacterium sp. CG_9.1]MBG6063260.1 nucleoside-diphosphate-sugar epimerase [Flavobacterium sp. CG_9.1]
MVKILVTGGSGFIGSNLVEYLSSKNHQVINYDIKKPRNKSFIKNWVKGDILNQKDLAACFESFNPDYVIHLAARTDLDEKQSITGYATNIEGVENIIDLINKYPTIKRTIYASSRMVCRIDYAPESFNDFCPPNLYGESKVIGEKIVKEKANHDFVIVRPTSIWGPYFEIPYRTFFDAVRKKMFFIPRNHNPKKSFGFVHNTTFQIEKILFASKEKVYQNYYLADYPALELKLWANLIAVEFNQEQIKTIPMLPLKMASKIGDALQKVGWKNPPLTTFRLNNLITNMVYDTTSLEKLCGELPYKLEESVAITTSWMKNNF